MRVIATISRLAFLRALHTRTFFLVLLFTVIAVAVNLHSSVVGGAGRPPVETARAIQITVLTDVVLFWSEAALIMGILLGASAIPGEVQAKILEARLAVTASRTRYVFAQWLGLQAFLLLFVGFGVAATLVVLQPEYFEPTKLFWTGVALKVSQNIVCTALAIGLGSLMRPVAAGVLTFLLAFLSDIVRSWTDYPWEPLRSAALLLSDLAPARLMGEPIVDGLRRLPLDSVGDLGWLVVADNAAYAVIALVICGAVFQRRGYPAG